MGVQVSAKLVVVATGVVSTVSSLLGGLFLYIEGLNLVENTVEEVSRADTQSAAFELGSSFTEAHIVALKYRDILNNWQGYDTPEQFIEWAKVHTLSEVVNAVSFIYCVGIAVLPVNDTPTNATVYYQMSWYDVQQDGSRKYLSGYYLPSMYNPSPDCSRRCVHANVVDPRTLQIKAFAYNYTELLGDMITNQFSDRLTGWETGKVSIWRHPSLWYAADGTPQVYLAHHVVAPPVANNVMMGMRSIPSTFVQVSSMEAALKQFQTSANLIVGVLDSVYGAYILTSNMGLATWLEGCADKPYKDRMDCVLKFDQAPPRVRDAGRVLGGILPGTFVRASIDGEEAWLRQVVIFQQGELDDLETMSLLWFRMVASVNDEMNRALALFIAFVILVFLFDMVIGISEVLLVARPLKQLAVAMVALEEMQLGEVRLQLERASTRFLAVSEVARLVTGIRFAVASLEELRGFLPASVIDLEESKGRVEMGATETPTDDAHELWNRMEALVSVVIETQPIPEIALPSSIAYKACLMHNKLVTESAERHQGIIVHSRPERIGNSFTIIFRNPRVALVFAVDLMMRVLLSSWPPEIIDKSRDRRLWNGPKMRLAAAGGTPSESNPFLADRAMQLIERVDYGFLAATPEVVALFGGADEMGLLAHVVTIGPCDELGGDIVVGIVPQTLRERTPYIRFLETPSVAKVAVKMITEHTKHKRKLGLQPCEMAIVHILLAWGDKVTQHSMDSFLASLEATLQDCGGNILNIHGCVVVTYFVSLQTACEFAGHLYDRLTFSKRSKTHLGISFGRVLKGNVSCGHQKFATILGTPLDKVSTLAESSKRLGLYATTDSTDTMSAELQAFTRAIEPQADFVEIHAPALVRPTYFAVGSERWRCNMWGNRDFATAMAKGKMDRVVELLKGPVDDVLQRLLPMQQGGKQENALASDAEGDPLGIVSIAKTHAPINFQPANLFQVVVCIDLDQSQKLRQTCNLELRNALPIFHRVVNEAMIAANGTEVVGNHDCFFVLFTTVESAINFAKAVLSRMQDATWPPEILTLLGSRALLANIVIHIEHTTENPLVDCEGPKEALHTALALVRVVEGGGIVLTEASYEALCDKSIPGVLDPFGEALVNGTAFPLRSVGEHEVRLLQAPDTIRESHDDLEKCEWFVRPALAGVAVLHVAISIASIVESAWGTLAVSIFLATISLFLLPRKHIPPGWVASWIVCLGVGMGIVQDILSRGGHELWLVVVICAVGAAQCRTPTVIGFLFAAALYLCAKLVEESWDVGIYNIFPNEWNVPFRQSTGSVFRGILRLVVYCAVVVFTFRHQMLQEDESDNRSNMLSVIQEALISVLSFDPDAGQKVVSQKGHILPSNIKDSMIGVLYQMIRILPYIPESKTVAAAGAVVSSPLQSQKSQQQQAQTFRCSSHPADFFQNRKISVAALNVRGILDMVQKVKGFGLAQSYLDVLLVTVVDQAKMHSGVVDSFFGDRVLLSFNALVKCPHHATNAATVALKLQSTGLVSANQLLRGMYQEALPLQLSIGVASGDALCGEMGCYRIKRFNCLGGAVSFAFVLEAYSSAWNIGVVCDTAVTTAVNDSMKVRLLHHAVFPKAYPEVTKIWELVALVDPEDWMYSEEQGKWTLYNEAVEKMLVGDYDGARAVVQCFDDGPLASHAGKLKQRIDSEEARCGRSAPKPLLGRIR